MLLGRLLQNEGRLAEAEQQFRAAVASDPDSGRAYVALANVLHANNRHEEAAHLNRRALELDPSLAGKVDNSPVAAPYLEDLAQ
jgi:Tfp pilus assembly protein PilF